MVFAGGEDLEAVEEEEGGEEEQRRRQFKRR